jgi:hypothetical protein
MEKIIRLAGVSYGDAQENIRKWGHKDIGNYALIREPENEHDSNAIQVSLFGEFYMGYIPKHIASKLAPLMDAGKEFIAEFVQINEWVSYDKIGMTIRIVEVGA